MSDLFHDPDAVRWGLTLLRITLILCAAWALHFLLRNRNPRWQILLWRAAIVGVIIVPLMSPWLPGWGPEIGKLPANAIRPPFAIVVHNSPSATPDATVTAVNAAAKTPTARGNSRSATTETPTLRSSQTETRPNAESPPFDSVVATVWQCYVAFVVCQLLVLLTEIFTLHRLCQQSVPAEHRFVALVSTIASRAGLKDAPSVSVSDGLSGPVVTGLLKPVLLLPSNLTNRLTEKELRFVIAHECSHLSGRDLWWSCAARIVRIVFWPHPLVWKLPAAHRLACDLRCDAVAAGTKTADYGTMLAQMALALHARSGPPLALAFLTKSEVVRRIRQVQSETDNACLTGRRRWLAALMLSAVSIVGTAGINGCADGDVDKDATDEIQILVLDENGEPVAAAEVRVEGLRTRKESASGYGNRLMTKGTTDEHGTADVRYPRYVYEAMETGQVTLNVTHPDFVMHRDDHSIDSPIEIRMKPGRKLTVTATNSETGEQITKGLYGLLKGHVGQDVWTRKEDGTLLSNALSLQTSALLLVCLQEGQPTLFSDVIDLQNYDARHAEINNVPMSPGQKLSGHLSDNVQPPVKNGNVGLAISLSLVNSPSYETCILWNDFQPLNEDGTFEFASVPRGADIQLTAVSDDWVSVAASPDSVLKRFPYVTTDQHAQNMHDTIVIAQSFPDDTAQPLILEMEATAKCEFTVVDGNSNPIANARIFTSPNTAWAPGPGGIIGHYGRTADGLGLSHEQLVARHAEQEKQRKDEDAVANGIRSYTATTDAAGKATVRGLPGKRGISVDIHHENFELPAGELGSFHRGVNVDLMPGETTAVTLKAQPKGNEVLGR